MITYKQIIEALKRGDFYVNYEGPGDVLPCTDWHGQPFLLSVGSAGTLSASDMLCLITVLDIEFIYDFKVGKWRTNDWTVYRAIRDALDELDVVGTLKKLGSGLDFAKHIFLLNTKFKEYEDAPIYQEDDPNCPENADNFEPLDSFCLADTWIGKKYYKDDVIKDWEKDNKYHLCEMPSPSATKQGCWQCRAIPYDAEYVADGDFYQCVELVLKSAKEGDGFEFFHYEVVEDEDGYAEDDVWRAKIVETRTSEFCYSPTHETFSTLSELTEEGKTSRCATPTE